ncbi:hypothetical protein SLEP1_g1832 [Rubroshorea leprosula]|uniref:Uncharacterized protein n=1 Tax=Rubroshorea leprosula TaxID=152421 RepID=A0AAV5HNV7_9ROSI|nr:hypothetical protein SLEP1_g1832 [Rubroshorea leprosula]
MRPISTSPVSVSTPVMTPLEKSPWHSPLPYLFGGLAAMLGLIAFALLILACSYWRLPGRLDNDEGGERDLESGEKEGTDAAKQPAKVDEEKILVIMAGQEKPTFLATPVTTKASSFNAKNGETEKNKGSEKVESSEKVKTELGEHEDEQIPTPVGETENEQQT